MNLQDGVSLSESLIVTLFSMGTVFLTLIVISFILYGFKLIFYNEKPKEEVIKKKTPPTEDTDGELISVIIAAIEAYDEENKIAVIAGAIAAHNQDTNKKLNVKNIKRIS